MPQAIYLSPVSLPRTLCKTLQGGLDYKPLHGLQTAPKRFENRVAIILVITRWPSCPHQQYCMTRLPRLTQPTWPPWPTQPTGLLQPTAPTWLLTPEQTDWPASNNTTDYSASTDRIASTNSTNHHSQPNQRNWLNSLNRHNKHACACGGNQVSKVDSKNKYSNTQNLTHRT